MITLENNGLTVRFPGVHPQATCRVEFQRTLRLPDDGKDHPLPPGFGRFPLHHVDDFPRVPEDWRRHGGVFLPMHPDEALWINFSADYPMAVKIAAGKINALTGESWDEALHPDPQDYCVLPMQPWLDGFCVAPGEVRQFVAMPLGEGYTAEEQITGKGEVGGLQFLFHPLRADAYERWRRPSPRAVAMDDLALDDMEVCFDLCEAEAAPDMGLAPGGRLVQEIYDDPFQPADWEAGVRSRCFVHLANASTYLAITGRNPPPPPREAREYAKQGGAWFVYEDPDAGMLEGAEILGELSSVDQWRRQKRREVADDEPLEVGPVVKLGPGRGAVRDGEF